MKKSIFLLLASSVLFSIVVKSQESRITYGFRFGETLNKFIGNSSQGNSLNQDLALNPHIGVNAEIPIATNFYFQPGLLLAVKGSKTTEIFNSISVTSTISIGYVEIPLNFIFKPALGSGQMLIGFGPYIAYGFFGGITQNPGKREALKFKNTVANSDPNANYLKPFDAGASVLVGYQFKRRFSLQLNGQMGLLGIQSKFEGDPDDESSYKNMGVGISLGYRFFQRK